MLKAQIVAGTYASGYIPLTKINNTNTVFKLNNNQVEVKKNGLVDVKANIVVTPTATGTLTATLYGNGTAINGALYTMTVASGDIYTFTINDVVQVAADADPDYATLGIQLSGAATLVGGDMICEYRQ